MLIFVNFKHIKIMIKIQLLVKNRKIKIINEKSIYGYKKFKIDKNGNLKQYI